MTRLTRVCLYGQKSFTTLPGAKEEKQVAADTRKDSSVVRQPRVFHQSSLLRRASLSRLHYQPTLSHIRTVDEKETVYSNSNFIVEGAIKLILFIGSSEKVEYTTPPTRSPFNLYLQLMPPT